MGQQAWKLFRTYGGELWQDIGKVFPRVEAIHTTRVDERQEDRVTLRNESRQVLS